MRKGRECRDWRECQIRDLIQSLTPGVSVSGEDRPAAVGELGVLKTSAATSGRFIANANKAVLGEQQSRLSTPVTAGAIVMCRSNSLDFVGASALVAQDHPNLFLSDKLWALTPRPGISAEWLACVLASPSVRLQLRDAASGSSASMKNVPQDRLLSIATLEPPLNEQRRIAEIVLTWDRCIEKTDQLIAAKAAILDHLSNALLIGRRRLGQKRAAWPSVALTEVTLEATARNGGDQLGANAVMGVNKLHGMIPMKEHVRAADLSRYKIVRPGAFAYNPMRLNIGSIAQNDHRRDVLVSPDYVVFEAASDALLPAYFDHLRRTSIWSCFVKNAGSGGVRVRIYYEDLRNFVLELPPVAEQARIVEALDTGRREISILEQQRDALATQKRGLMQKLLTGEWPVSAPNSQEAAE
jgi:type I restriction enzyme S subunit